MRSVVWGDHPPPPLGQVLAPGPGPECLSWLGLIKEWSKVCSPDAVLTRGCPAFTLPSLPPAVHVCVWGGVGYVWADQAEDTPEQQS